MRRFGTFLLAVLALTGLYLTTWPVPVDPVAWNAPPDRGLTGAFAPNDALAGAATINLDDYEGPEDVTVGHDGALLDTQYRSGGRRCV